MSKPLTFDVLDNLSHALDHLIEADKRSNLTGAVSTNSMRLARGDSTMNLAKRELDTLERKGWVKKRGALWWITPAGIDVMILTQMEAENKTPDQDFSDFDLESDS